MEPSTRPSRESLREVKREARQRARAQKNAHRRMQRQWGTTPPWHRRWPGALSWVGAAVVVALAAFLLLGPDRLGTGPSEEDAELTAAQTPRTPPPSPPAAGAGAFAGTDVATWQEGARAVVTPKPAQVGPFSPAQVASAYAKAKAYVLASSLDPKVLYEGTVEPVQATVDRRTSGYLSGLVVNASQELSPVSYATRFRRGVAPASDVVKGQVRMTAAASRQQGQQVLTVHVKSVFVYALRPVDEAGGMPELVTARREVDLEFLAAGRGSVGKPSLGPAHFVSTGEVCGETPQQLGYLSVYFDDKPVGDQGQAPSYDVKDLDDEAPDSECFQDSSG